MNLKKLIRSVAVSFLILGGTMTFFPAENILSISIGYASQDSVNESLIEMYTEQIQKNPKDVQAYFNRGLAYCGYEDDKAVKDFTMCIKFEPNNPKGYLHRGIAYRNARQYDNAIQDFDKVISMNPGNVINYMNRAETYYLAKNYDKARADYKKVIPMNPGKNPELEKAKKDLEKFGMDASFLNQPPIVCYAYYGLGLIDYEQRDYESALENFNKALNGKATFMFYAARSKCYQKLGDTQKANADLKKAKELKKKENAELDAFDNSVKKNMEIDIDIEEYE